jgi:serine/threonine-protein kinase
MSGPLSAGQVIGGRYEVLRYLAEGGMQFVYVAKDQVTDREVALKTPKNESAQKRFRRSAIVAAKVNHPNVAKTFDYIDEGERTFLVEELILGEDMKIALLTKTDHVDPYLVAKIFHHLSKGVAAAHHNEVVHRDLKPTNIMIVGGYNLDELKLTDFGIAKMAEVELEEGLESEESLIASATALGAIPYMAPEAIEAPETVGLPADIWSVGAIMLHVLYGYYPFGSGLKAVSRITKDELPTVPDFVLENSQFEPLAREIIEIAHSCLQKDPAHRPTADELVKKCNSLCYTVSGRKVGSIKNYFFNDSWGFIRTPGEDVFFHKDCVFGDKPQVNDRVLFSSYDGGQAQRALPVLKLK